MTIGPGVRLGPYEIVAPIGSGGMGEVFRAHDTRLNRTVAIKVLAQDRNQNPDMRQRFEREARMIATLSHPHICHVNDIGQHDGIDYLVMEHLDGESLAARLARTGQSKPALEIGEVIRYATEIAEALSEAHRRGIVHRDLKPANVFLARSGAPSSPPTVKLLDFGLAKLHDAPVGVGAGVPAATTEVPLTRDGSIVGTWQYMAPEQLEGKPVDARTDIFAFGIVVYEMATGRRPFSGDSQARLIAAILGTDPPFVSTLQPAAPAALDRIIRKCLAKDPDARWQSARDLADELKWIAEEPASARSTAAPPRRWGWVLALAAALLVAAAALALIPRNETIAEPIRRFSIVAPIDAPLAGPEFSYSSDGRRVVYRARTSRGFDLRLRDLDQLEPRAIPGTANRYMPIFSPDGQSVAFIAEGKLKKVALTAGATPIAVCDFQSASPGMVWLPDNTIILGRISVGLFRVSANGGTPVALTTADASRREIDHHNPSALPGGKAILLTVHRGAEAFDIAVQRLDTNERRVVMPDAFDARYLASGHLVFGRGDALFAATFDANRHEVTGPAVVVIDNVATVLENGTAAYGIATDGSLSYVPTVPRNGRRLAWIDRRGVKELLPAGARAYAAPSLSPDGRRLALQIDDGTRRDIWVYEMGADALTRMTFDGVSEAPIWTPDGNRLTFSVTKEGQRQIYWQPVDSPGQAELLVAGEHSVWPGSWSPDSATLLFTRETPTGQYNVGMFRLADRQATMFPGVSEGAPRVSPDGRWLAYSGWDGQRPQIYVRALTGAGGKRQLSTERSGRPVWNRDGRELFFRTFERFMIAPVASLPAGPGKPAQLPTEVRIADSDSFHPGYDVSLDGQRLLVVEPADEESAPQPIHVVLNWINDLKARVLPR